MPKSQTEGKNWRRQNSSQEYIHVLFPCTSRNQQASEVLLKFFKQNMRKCWHHSKILKAQTILLDNIYSIFPKGFLKLPLVQHLHPPVNLLLPPNPSKRVISYYRRLWGNIRFHSIKPRWPPSRATQAVTRVLPELCCGMTQDETESDSGSYQTDTREGFALESHPCTFTLQLIYAATVGREDCSKRLYQGASRFASMNFSRIIHFYAWCTRWIHLQPAF